MALTILLALLFTQLQVYEFRGNGFAISDSVYGTVFYSLTGLHAFHVIVGTALLARSY